MQPGTSFPFRFVKTDESQDANPKEEQVLGMDKKQNIILTWQLNDLSATPEGVKPAALIIGD